MQKEILLTEEGFNKLKEELSSLKARRKEVAERIRLAREFGDLSENSEYEDARNEQSFVEGRIQELKQMIDSAKIIAKTGSDGKIAMGSKVTLELDGEKFTYELVGANESDPSAGRISIESPLGHALLGKTKGDKAEIHGPGGVIIYKIIDIK